MLGILSLADHIYAAATDSDIDEVNLDPETIILFPGDAPGYVALIDQACRSAPAATNVTTLMLQVK